MDKDFLPLLLASDRLRPDDESQPLDRLRMQKGVFLLQMRGSGEWRNLFDFEPYDWGPYSRDLQRTVAALIQRGLLERVEVPGRRYGRYRTTPEGEALLGFAFTSAERQFAGRVRRFLAERSFTSLLRDVYAAYPEYAVNSRFNR